MPTADLALLLLSVLGLALLVGTGSLLPKLGSWLASFRDERLIRQERLKQERLKTELLEEQLRNEILRDLARKPRHPLPEAQDSPPPRS